MLVSCFPLLMLYKDPKFIVILCCVFFVYLKETDRREGWDPSVLSVSTVGQAQLELSPEQRWDRNPGAVMWDVVS